MFATIRRTALALAGAGALLAAGSARADHDCDRTHGFDDDDEAWPQQAWPQQAYPPPAWQAPYADEQGQPVDPPPAWQPEDQQAAVPPPPLARLHFSVALPAPPAWLPLAPPPVPAYGMWTRRELEREYHWLDAARARFYRLGAWNPWRTRLFETWYQARRGELDRRWNALAWAPVPRHGWRGAGWSGRFGEGWGRGRWERQDDY